MIAVTPPSQIKILISSIFLPLSKDAARLVCMDKETNVLKAICHIVEKDFINIDTAHNYNNRIQVQGESFESFVKRLFSLTLYDEELDPKLFELKGDITNIESDIDERSLEIFQKYFSWLGSANNPPDLKIKNGDCIEVKKRKNPFGELALNSSPPRAKMKKDDPMIQKKMKDCEKGWEESDVLYVVGVEHKTKPNQWKHIWMFYGDVLFDDNVYESIRSDLISPMKNMLDDFASSHNIINAETNEIGRLNNFGNNNISHLRIRGMYGTKALDYLKNEGILSSNKSFCVVMRNTKFDSFPKEDKDEIQKLSEEELLSISTSMISDPSIDNNKIGVKIISILDRDQLNL